MNRVAIVGAGLAGLTAALRLAENGCRVTLFESRYYAGGKASAHTIEGAQEDHGFHFFAGWYANTRQLIADLKLEGHFIDLNEFVDLRRGEYPRHRVIHNPARISLRTFVSNVRSGFLSFPDLFLFHYSTLELLAEPFSQRRFLDQISVHGFVASRFYASSAIAEQHNEVLFKSISNPSHLVSAMTYQKMLGYWAGTPTPMFQMLNTDLQSGFIEPLVSRFRELGGELAYGHTLTAIDTHDGRVQRLQFNGPHGVVNHEDFDACVIAVPHEAVTSVVDDRLHAAEPMFGSCRQLRSEPMAACTVYCRGRLEQLPARHVICRGSRLGLSFVDIGQVWAEYDRSVLSVVASDFTTLKGLSEPLVLDCILEELRAYVPECTGQMIERAVLQPHESEPLFMNDVGVWAHRPTTLTRLENCVVAGDYCRNEIDLVSMESAVVSGLHAAKAVLRYSALIDRVLLVVPPVPRRWILVLARLGLLPLAVLMWLTSVAHRRLSGTP